MINVSPRSHNFWLLKISGALLLLVLLSACSSIQTYLVDKKALDEIECTVVQDDEGYESEHCLTGYQSKPFNGMMTSGDPTDVFFRGSQYRDGIKNGFSFETINGQPHIIGRFSDGLLDGEQVLYHKGILKKRDIYAQGKKIIEYIYASETGLPAYFTRFREDEVIESITYDQNGRNWMHTFYEDGEQRSRWTDYFANGQVKSIRLSRKKDNQQLSKINYYSNGKVESQSYFDKNKNTSIKFVYWRNGRPSSEQHYSHPSLNWDGPYLSYCEQNGVLETIGYYRMNKKHGVFEDYYCNGQLKERVNYRDGVVIDKEVKTYRDNGKLAIFKKMDGKGKVLETFYYDRSGKLNYRE